MPITQNVALFVLLSIAAPAVAQTPAPATNVVACDQATTTRPGVGVDYRGRVMIDDYKFAANIPKGMSGWGGVASSAPFHGFTIFLDRSMRTCIVLEIHIRVDRPDAPPRPASAKPLSLGKATAWQISMSGATTRANLNNIATYFTFEHDGEIDDGEVLLVSPPTELGRAVPVYENLLKSIRFGTRRSRSE